MKKQQTVAIGEYWPATKAAQALGMSLATLRQLAEDGKIECYMTPGGKLRYDVAGFLSRAKAATRARLDRKAAAKRAPATKPNEPLLPGVREADEANKNSMSQYVADAPRLSS